MKKVLQKFIRSIVDFPSKKPLDQPFVGTLAAQLLPAEKVVSYWFEEGLVVGWSFMERKKSSIRSSQLYFKPFTLNGPNTYFINLLQDFFH